MNGYKMIRFAIPVLSMVAMLASPQASMLSFAQAATKQETVQAISNHFSSVPTMVGEFVQFGPTGEQTGGKFYLQRPGKLRFIYEEPSPLMLIANGKTVAINNRKLKTWDFYPLRKTPLKLLLSDHMAIDDASIRSISTETDIIKVVMGNDQIFGKSEITLLFDPESLDLRQWTIKDAQGKETSVMIFNVQKNVKIPQWLFKIDQLAITRKKYQNR